MHHVFPEVAPLFEPESLTHFKGVSIRVFFILANAPPRPGTTTATAADFSLDGLDAGRFEHSPDIFNADLLYDQVVFSRTGLPNRWHTLDIVAHGDQSLYLNFDYAIYECVTYSGTSSTH